MNCALCGTDLQLVLDLGKQPPANRYRRQAELLWPEPSYPLRLGHCPSCQHAQLMDTVEPEALFTEREYLYRSGVSAGWLSHCADLVRTMPRGNGGIAVDIGSNDGTLLGQLAARGYKVVGVEPNHPLNALHGFDTFPTFWGEEVARWVKKRFREDARIVTAQNVLAHVPDPVAFLAAAAECLHQDGTLVIEVPHLLPMLETGAFDPIYHEHIHYWSLLALQRAIFAAGLSVVAVEEIAVHGGSLRVWAGFPHRTVHDSVDKLMIREATAFQKGAWPDFVWKVDDFKTRWRELLAGYRDSGRTVWAYGAAAKAMTLLNTIPVPEGITRFMDDNPAKQGWYTPGQPIPIGKLDRLDEPDVVVLTAWNWRNQMDQRLRALGFRGTTVIPFPSLEVVA